jgi:hypothetical protein
LFCVLPIVLSRLKNVSIYLECLVEKKRGKDGSENVEMKKILFRDFDGANDQVRRRLVLCRLSVSEKVKKLK